MDGSRHVTLAMQQYGVGKNTHTCINVFSILGFLSFLFFENGVSTRNTGCPADEHRREKEREAGEEIENQQRSITACGLCLWSLGGWTSFLNGVFLEHPQGRLNPAVVAPRRASLHPPPTGSLTEESNIMRGRMRWGMPVARRNRQRADETRSIGGGGGEESS